jgi:PAS domain S-box-containing protein
LRLANQQLAQENAERQRAESRISAFSKLGHRLSTAKTAKEAALIVVVVADELLGWDACVCDLYSAETDQQSHLLSMDLIDGIRRECPPLYTPGPPTPTLREVLETGGKLVLREQLDPPPEALPFGDQTRRSASLMYVPIRNGNKTVGILSIQSYRHHAYDAASLETLQALADHCGGALDRVRTEEALQHRLQMENLVSTLSSSFINLSADETDAAVVKALKLIGEFVGADHGRVFCMAPEGKRGDNTHQWIAEGFEACLRGFKHLRADRFPWCMAKLLRFETIHFPDIADLPDEAAEERALISTFGIKSSVAVPMVYGNSLMGFLGFDAVRRGMNWAGEDLALLKTVGEIFANALLHKRAEERLLRLNRLYSASSRISGMITHTRSVEALCSEACQIVVEEGRLTMAWVGILEPATQAIRAVAQWGVGEAYARQINVSAAANVPEGLGPAGIAVREGKFQVRHEMEDEPALAPWRDIIVQAGYRSIAAFPLKAKGTTVGVLSLYQSEPHFFNDEEVRLLSKLSEDLSFAIEFLEQAQQLQVQRTALESAANSVVITNPEGLVLWHNAAFTELTGYAGPEVIGKKTSMLRSGKQGTAFYQHLWETIASGQVWRGELTNRRKDGRFYDEEMTITPVRGEQGVITHYVAIKQDVTARKLAEVRLAAFSSLGQRLSTAKAVKEAAQVVVDVADQVLGWDACGFDVYSPAEELVTPVLYIDIINHRRTECTPAARPPSLSALAKKSLEEGGLLILRGPADTAAPATQRFGNSNRLSASILYVPIRNASSLMGFLSIQSYTPQAYDRHALETLQALADRCGGALDRIKAEEALRSAQEQLRQSQKMEAIGQLAGGVAHDFNNLLAVIQGNTDLALMEADKFCSQTIDCLHQVTAASDRAANLTRQLLAFSRKQMMQSQPVNLTVVAANLTKMLNRIIGEDVELQCHYGEHLPFVQADVGMLDQVIINLAVNARDAMPRGGQLHITTAKFHSDAAYASTHAEARPGEFVALSVKDSGCGIPPEQLPRIFEPFYTTKELGKGTGLGLATVYGIVKQHQGWIEVDSQVGVGTTFTIILPAMANPPTVADAPEKAAKPRGGTETILLVEDEQAVRRSARFLLERFGYRVLEAASGPEALKVWSSRQNEIQLLLSDIIMPNGLTGRDLMEQLRLEKPGLKTILMSGYSGTAFGRNFDFAQDANTFFLQKPFPMPALLNTVRKCLDS